MPVLRPRPPVPHRNPTRSLDRQLAFAVLRLTLGANLLVHGLVRLPTLSDFADGLVDGFAGTILPTTLVHGFALALPPLEALVGGLLVLGLFTRGALVVGGLLMTALVFGTALRQQWDTLGLQMIYALTYFLLQFNAGYNRFSLDQVWRRLRGR